VVLLLLAAVGVSIVAPSSPWSLAAIIAIEGGAVLIALSWTSARGVVFPLLSIFVVVSVIVGALPSDAAHTLATLLDLGVLLALPVVFVIRFRRNLIVTMQSVFAAVSIYLVIGMLYAIFDATLTHFSGQRFFAQNVEATTSQYTYFSFITLCTVGYGDLTPATSAARAVVVSEALLGQLYLVTVIALVVSNLGHRRGGARTEGD
jgi:hypothetical protein